MPDVASTQPAHLTDLFETGQEVPITYPGKPETAVWVERPNPDQHEECMRKARADRARRYHELMDPESDERLALVQDAEAMDKEALVEAILEKYTRNLERQALNDVLFSEEFGSDWGKEGEKWTAVLDGLQARFEEINVHNKALDAAKAEEGQIDIEADPEVVRLTTIQDQFQADVAARSADLVTDKKIEIALENIKALRKDLIQQRIELECDLQWFASFKYEQLYYAVRYPNDHTQLYFRRSSQIKSLPNVVQEQLMDGLNEVDLDVDALKNSLTPLPS